MTLAANPGRSPPECAAFACPDPHLVLRGLHAGYGKMAVLHGVDLAVGRGESACIVGPNGSGKSTILNAVVGLADVLAGTIEVAGRNVAGASPRTILMEAKLGYVLQANSAFPDMTVEENLLIGGHLLPPRVARRAVERVFDSYPQLRMRRGNQAAALSGGERRLLELSRALINEPDILLVDEPSIGLEPRVIDAVFGVLDRLQRVEGKTIVVVEQNVRKGLDFADLGYVVTAGRVVVADRAARIRDDENIARLFLGT